MYLLSDKAAAIREVQKYLYSIHYNVNSEVPRISIDGIYGDETKNAVIAFQKIYGLPESGAVDYPTFAKMYEIYFPLSVNLKGYVVTEVGFPIQKGMQGNDVIIIHTVIDELGKTYSDIGRVDPKSNYYSIESERAVLNLQRLFRTEENGIVDSTFYERIQTELSAIRRLKEEYI